MKEKNDASKEFAKIPPKKYKPDAEKKSNTKNKLIAAFDYLQKKYEFRYNMVVAKTEYSIKDKNKFKFFDERSFDNLIMELKMEAGIQITADNFRSMLGGPIATDYHPFKDYLLSLPKWDRRTDHFVDFLKQVQLLPESTRPLFIKYFKKWFVALVASMVDDYARNDTCFVLVGPQGRRKTTFLNYLVPKHLRLYYLYNGNYRLNDKDHEEMLGSKILINLDELATLNRVDVEQLKSRITQDQINLRRAYGRAPIHLWRRASFCASINRGEFLTDTTGTRRFLVFTIHNIDLNENFDIGDLYAQAFALYRDGFQYFFDQIEIEELEKNNLKFRDVPMEEELIQTNYIIPVDSDKAFGGVRYMTTSDIANALADDYKKINVNDSYRRKVGAALTKLGFKRMAKRLKNYKYPVKVWEVKPVGSLNLDPDVNEESNENLI